MLYGYTNKLTFHNQLICYVCKHMYILLKVFIHWQGVYTVVNMGIYLLYIATLVKKGSEGMWANQKGYDVFFCIANDVYLFIDLYVC